MKTGALLLSLVPSLLLVGGCGASQTAEQTRTTSAALTVEPSQQKESPTSAEKWAEDKVKEEASKSKGSGVAQKGGDPLAMNDAFEDSNIPKVEMTPAREVRAKSHGDLDAAMALLKGEASVDGAVKKLTVRLGKPSWTENGQKRIWVSGPAGAQCHRLVLEADGTAEIETASKTEWRMLTATARQNPCTGEIKRGIESK